MFNLYKKASIRMKLMILFILLILINSSISMYYNYNVRKMTQYYNETQDVYYNVNSIFISLQNAKSELENYINNGDMQAYLTYVQEKNTVNYLLSTLENKRDNRYEWYMIHAMENSISSYFKECDITIRKRINEDEFYYLNFYKSKNILKYIPNYINEYLNILLEENSTEFSYIEKNLAQVHKVNTLILWGSIIAGILYTSAFANFVTKPIRRLAQVSKEMAKGNLDIPSLDVVYDDEVGELTHSFNTMSESIRSLIEDLNQKAVIEAKLYNEELKNLKTDELLREAQFLALQSQINPHFLFNTLNSISRAAVYETPKITTTLIENLADLFRYNIEYINKYSTVEKELSIVEKYIYIQTHRFRERINYKVTGDKNCYFALIPSMILQPLVENAIIHGIENLEFGGLIVVNTKKKYDSLCLRIFDNGVGISKEIQKTIMEGKIEKHTGHTTAIGLSNIIARVNLIQGGTFRIYSSPRYGTMIQIVIPIMTGELLNV